MTKKHFISLADTVRDTEGRCEPFTEKQLELLADWCRSQNPQFDRSRWLGYIAGICGPSGGTKGYPDVPWKEALYADHR